MKYLYQNLLFLFYRESLSAGPELVLYHVKHFRLLDAQSGVPVVLDRVIGTAQEEVCHIAPSILERLSKEKQYPVLFFRP